MTAKAKKKDELCHPGAEQLCAAMKLALQETQKSSGLHTSFMLSKNHIDTCIGYKGTIRKAKLLIFNFCPWCGRSVAPPKRGTKPHETRNRNARA